MGETISSLSQFNLNLPLIMFLLLLLNLFPLAFASDDARHFVNAIVIDKDSSSSSSSSTFQHRSAVDWFEATGPTDLCRLPKGLIGDGFGLHASSVRRQSLITVCERVKKEIKI